MWLDDSQILAEWWAFLDAHAQGSGGIFCTPPEKLTFCSWFRNPARKRVEVRVVYPFIYECSYTSKRWLALGFRKTINNIHLKHRGLEDEFPVGAMH